MGHQSSKRKFFISEKGQDFDGLDCLISGADSGTYGTLAHISEEKHACKTEPMVFTEIPQIAGIQ